MLLDPLVRLYGVEENHATEVAGLLTYFRELQRKPDLSVILVNHTRKTAALGVAAGQGLRCSSDLYAFGDSNLYLHRTWDRLVLFTEHRAAPASPPAQLELESTDAATTHLKVVAEERDDGRGDLRSRVLAPPSEAGRAGLLPQTGCGRCHDATLSANAGGNRGRVERRRTLSGQILLPAKLSAVGCNTRPGVRVPMVPGQRQQTDHAHDHTGDQWRKSHPKELHRESTILGRADVGEDSKKPKNRETQERQGNQDREHSQSKHEESEDTHGHSSSGIIGSLGRSP